MESQSEDIEFTILHRFEYFFSLKDDKGIFRTNKFQSCMFVILAETREQADEYLKKEVDTAFAYKIEDLSDYKCNLSDTVYSSDAWNSGLLFYDIKPVN